MNDRVSNQRRLIAALHNPAVYPHPVSSVESLETHISIVLLAGDFAYKIKKPLNLGFLDFESLEDRRHYCEEELRLNSRLAPDIYLEAVAIHGSPDEPTLEDRGPVIEYAVKMRRFSQEALLDRRIDSHGLDLPLMDRLAEQVARFHADVAKAPGGSEFGTPQAVLQPMQENFAVVAEHVTVPDAASTLQRIEQATWHTWERLRPLLVRRLRDGFVRECHGDMHLGNMAEVDGDLIIFDGIEFSPALRWIDVINDIAFLCMDLDHRESLGLGWRFLNRYCNLTGDYEGLVLLQFYEAYRAMVRAKVSAIRLGQPGLGRVEVHAILDDCRVLLDLADWYLQPPEPGLIVCGGVSGSGKTFLADRLARRFGLVHLRSDVERKRLFGLAADESSGSNLDEGLYTPEATDRTYARLAELSHRLLGGGLSVVVDATFLTRERRAPLLQVARRNGAPSRILWVEAPEQVIRERIEKRQRIGRDASEADVAVVAAQMDQTEPPGPDEPGTRCSSDLRLPEGSLQAWLGRL